MYQDIPSFEELVALYQDDPETFEELREAYINRLIESAPEAHQKRLRGLQFQIEMERKRARSPVATCIRLSNMMNDCFAHLCNKVDVFYDEAEPEKMSDHKAQVIDLTNRRQ